MKKAKNTIKTNGAKETESLVKVLIKEAQNMKMSAACTKYSTDSSTLMMKRGLR